MYIIIFNLIKSSDRLKPIQPNGIDLFISLSLLLFTGVNIFPWKMEIV